MCQDRPMLHPRHVRDLLVDPQLHPRGQPHLSAASGLARVKGLMYVIADDEHHLGVFDPTGTADAPVALARLFEGDLPQDKGQRKAAKPDLESLAALPPLPGCPFGALLALGSGSLSTRKVGVLAALDVHGALSGRVAQVDLSPLYAPLRLKLGNLNIEGVFLASGELRLLQRGSKADARNACISYDWNLIVPWLVGQKPVPPPAKAIQIMELGDIDGVPLSLTDGAAVAGGGWVFSAVAENSRNSVQDGPCVGSAVGVVGVDGAVRQLHRLEGSPKVEGIAVQEEGNDVVLTLVTDADDPAKASQVLEVRIALA